MVRADSVRQFQLCLSVATLWFLELPCDLLTFSVIHICLSTECYVYCWTEFSLFYKQCFILFTISVHDIQAHSLQFKTTFRHTKFRAFSTYAHLQVLAVETVLFWGRTTVLKAVRFCSKNSVTLVWVLNSCLFFTSPRCPWKKQPLSEWAGSIVRLWLKVR